MIRIGNYGGKFDMSKKMICIFLCTLFIFPILSVTAAGNPEIEIGGVSGGLFTLRIEITNTGDVDATDLNWNITINGGLLAPSSRKTSDSDILLKSGESMIAVSKLINGIGRIQILIRANASGANEVVKKVDALLLFFYIIVEQNE
jgi:hypothetical protein